MVIIIKMAPDACEGRIPYYTFTCLEACEVLKLYFESESCNKIANACGISKSSVVNIIDKLKKGICPEFNSLLGQVDVLRDLAVELRKLGLKVPMLCLQRCS